MFNCYIYRRVVIDRQLLVNYIRLNICYVLGIGQNVNDLNKVTFYCMQPPMNVMKSLRDAHK